MPSKLDDMLSLQIEDDGRPPLPKRTRPLDIGPVPKFIPKTTKVEQQKVKDAAIDEATRRRLEREAADPDIT